MFISFIIPCRNENTSLPVTIRNLEKAAAGISYEIIVIDDASDIPIENTISCFQSCRVLRQENRIGVAKSRALGAKAASGDLLLFLDAHVCLQAGSLQKLFDAHVQNPNSILGIPYAHVYDFEKFALCEAGDFTFDTGITAGWYLFGRDRIDAGPLRLKKHAYSYVVPIVGAAGLFISKKQYENLGGFDEGLVGFGNGEDTELCLMSWTSGYDVRIVPNALLVHYLEEEKLQLKEETRKTGVHHQYDESEKNIQRIISLYFPDIDLEIFKVLKEKVKISEISYQDRSDLIESKRSRSRDQVMKIFFLSFSMFSKEKKAKNILLADSIKKVLLFLDSADSKEPYHAICTSDEVYEGLRGMLCSEDISMMKSIVRFQGEDEIYEYYRFQVWERASSDSESILESILNKPKDSLQKVEDLFLHYFSPAWLIEDVIKFSLDIENDFHAYICTDNEALKYIYSQKFYSKNLKIKVI